MKQFILNRDVTVEECHWLFQGFKKGEAVYKFTGPTYGCISPSGTACSDENGIGPFFELPTDALHSSGPTTMNYEDEAIRADVNAGAHWLDQVLPDGWAHLIDTSVLRMASVNDCIFGQLFGSDLYDDIVCSPGPAGITWTKDHGFSIFGKKFWLEEIEWRL